MAGPEERNQLMAEQGGPGEGSRGWLVRALDEAGLCPPGSGAREDLEELWLTWDLVRAELRRWGEALDACLRGPDPARP